MWPFLSQVFADTRQQATASVQELADAARREAAKVRSALAGDVTQAGVGASVALGAAIDPSHANTSVIDAVLAKGWAPWLFLGFVVISAALILRRR
jgi:hypothetical protein